MLVLKVGDYVTIKYQDKIIASGEIKSIKEIFYDTACLLISFDNKYFFNLYSDFISEGKCFDIEGINVLPWNDYEKDNTALIYEDNTINELDKEVEHIVSSLNNINGIRTTGSCCGHNKEKLWIIFECNNFLTLKRFTDLFNDGMFNKSWVVRTDFCNVSSKSNNIVLLLECKYKGNKSYKLAEELATYLDIVGEL